MGAAAACWGTACPEGQGARGREGAIEGEWLAGLNHSRPAVTLLPGCQGGGFSGAIFRLARIVCRSLDGGATVPCPTPAGQVLLGNRLASQSLDFRPAILLRAVLPRSHRSCVSSCAKKTWPGLQRKGRGPKGAAGLCKQRPGSLSSRCQNSPRIGRLPAVGAQGGDQGGGGVWCCWWWLFSRLRHYSIGIKIMTTASARRLEHRDAFPEGGHLGSIDVHQDMRRQQLAQAAAGSGNGSHLSRCSTQCRRS